MIYDRRLTVCIPPEGFGAPFHGRLMPWREHLCCELFGHLHTLSRIYHILDVYVALAAHRVAYRAEVVVTRVGCVGVVGAPHYLVGKVLPSAEAVTV